MLHLFRKDGALIRVVMLTATALFFVVAAVLAIETRQPLAVALFYGMMAVILVLGSALVLYFRRRRYGSGQSMDERERMVTARADAAAGLAITIIWCLAFLIPTLVARVNNQSTMLVQTRWLAPIMIAGLLIQMLVRACASWVIRRHDRRH